MEREEEDALCQSSRYNLSESFRFCNFLVNWCMKNMGQLAYDSLKNSILHHLRFFFPPVFMLKRTCGLEFQMPFKISTSNCVVVSDHQKELV